MIENSFSDNTNKIIEHSRLVSLRLGYDYISSLHLFIADCEYGNGITLFDFGFLSHQEFDIFFESCSIGETNILSEDTLPLTLELEKIINRSVFFRNKQANSFIEPAHIFLAAAEDKTSIFFTLFPDSPDLFGALEKYYLEKNIFVYYEENLTQHGD